MERGEEREGRMRTERGEGGEDEDGEGVRGWRGKGREDEDGEGGR